MQADLCSEHIRTEVRQLLLESVEGRVKLIGMVRGKRTDEVFQTLNRADAIQMRLWSLGRQIGASEAGALPQSVLGLMDMQTRRTHAALVTRIPLIIWVTLYFTAVMAMIVVGYQAGLTDRRSPFATFSLSLAFSALMNLIMDLDRPLQSFFELHVAVMSQLAEFMQPSL